MKYNKHNGADVSILGMGAMRLPVQEEVEGKPIDYAKAEAIIDYAMANGITYYDTAWVYHGGESETFLGKALVDRYPREKFTLATKFNIGANPDYKFVFEEQLKKMHTDYIDYYLLHAIGDNTADKYLDSGCVEYFIEQQKKGRIKYLGFSAHSSPETLKRVANYRKWDFAQIQLNYFDWVYGTAKAEYEVLREADLPIVVMESIRGGRLSDLTPETNAMLKACEPDRSVSSWALRYLMTLPGILVMLSGMSNLEQIEDNIGTASGEALTEEQVKLLFEVNEKFHTQVQIPCTGCNYCGPNCPMGIQIPEVLKIYNDVKVNGMWGAKEKLEKLEKGPKDCIGCQSCEGHCPQTIGIAALMAEFAEKLG